MQFVGGAWVRTGTNRWANKRVLVGAIRPVAEGGLGSDVRGTGLLGP